MAAAQATLLEVLTPAPTDLHGLNDRLMAGCDA